MADIIDDAQEVTERHTAVSLAAHAARLVPQQKQNQDGSWPITECVDCEDELPPARLAMARIRCVMCQGLLDDAEKRKLK